MGREDIAAADDQHVVGPTRHLLHPAHAARRAGEQAGEVAGAIADYRRRLLSERGENELAKFSGRANGAGRRVDDLRVEMILPDVRAVLALDALHGDAWADHFREAIDVD